MALCAEKPTVALLKRIALELPIQLKKITDEHQYLVSFLIEESAVLVTDETITVKVFLTSPLLRDPQGIYSRPILPLGVKSFDFCTILFFFFSKTEENEKQIEFASQSRCDIDHG